MGKTRVGFNNTYVYDDAGNRVQETTGGTTSYYLTDDNNPTGYAEPIEAWTVAPANRTGSSEPAMTYLIGDDVFGQASASGTVDYYIIDGHGSTRALITSTGAVLTTPAPGTNGWMNYDAFGDAVGDWSLSYAATNAGVIFLCAGDAVYDPASGLYMNGDGVRDRSGFRFTEMDSSNPGPGDLADADLYEYASADSINGFDPSGDAVYFVERQFSASWGEYIWDEFGHGYLLFTPTSDPGSADPFAAGQPAIDTFSFHPSTWNYDDYLGTPSRVWEDHPDDTNPASAGLQYHTFLVTANPAQDLALQAFIKNWIHSMPVGYDFGNPITDPSDPQNEIGIRHIDAPPNGVSYSVAEQNCVWWCTIMLKQSGIPVPPSVYSAIGAYNAGEGGGPQVVNGQRSANEVDDVTDDWYRNLTALDTIIDAFAFGAAAVGVV